MLPDFFEGFHGAALAPVPRKLCPVAARRGRTLEAFKGG